MQTAGSPKHMEEPLFLCPAGAFILSRAKICGRIKPFPRFVRSVLHTVVPPVLK